MSEIKKYIRVKNLDTNVVSTLPLEQWQSMSREHSKKNQNLVETEEPISTGQVIKVSSSVTVTKK